MTQLRAIRSPERLPEQTVHACNLALSMARLVVENLATGLYPAQREYFIKNIQPSLAVIVKYKSMDG
jgi:hypothetical protein